MKKYVIYQQGSNGKTQIQGGYFTGKHYIHQGIYYGCFEDDIKEAKKYTHRKSAENAISKIGKFRNAKSSKCKVCVVVELEEEITEDTLLKNNLVEQVNNSETEEQLKTITLVAPETINLSELIKNLISYKDSGSSVIKVETDFDGSIILGEKLSTSHQGYIFITLIKLNKNMRIVEINTGMTERTKWLFKLWVAGTVIINDIK